MTKRPASVAVIVSVLASSGAVAAEKTVTLAVQHMTCSTRRVGCTITFWCVEVDLAGSPLLGEHADEVPKSLGYRAADIANLQASGAVCPSHRDA